jgi:hypothetical protein
MTCSLLDVLGVDIGGVIIDAVREDRDARVDPPAIEGAFEAIARLHQERFSARCWLVSRCKDRMEAVITDWLDRHGFFPATGMRPEQLIFCREPREKAEICRELVITHFIDDRLAVLSHMIDVVPNLYLFLSRASEVDQFEGAFEKVRTISRWSEVADLLLEYDAQSRSANNASERARDA